MEQKRMKNQIIFAVIISLIVGILLGGILFSDTQPRSLIAINNCTNCLDPNEFAGLVGSVIVQKTPGIIPERILETEYTIVFKHPLPSYETQYVFVPKKDIKDLGNLSSEDIAYITDLFAAAAKIITENNFQNYRFWTNGPGFQGVNYLHFHLGVE